MQYSEAELIKNSEIDIRTLFAVIWQGKWVIILFTTLLTSLGVWYAIKLPNIYTSNVVLAKVEDGGGGALSSLKSEFGGFAALAGVNLNSKPTGNSELALQILKSRSFLNDFIEKYDFKAALFATKGWDKEANRLIFDPALFDEVNQTWLKDPNTGKSLEPSIQEVKDTLMKNVISIEEIAKQGIVTITVTHYSPFIAKQIAEKLVSEINDKVQHVDINEASARITYLKKALYETPIADMQRIFYQLIEQQEQKKMLAQTQSEYVFKTIDPAVVPEVKTGPRRALICLAAIFVGFVLSVFFVITYHYVIRNQTRDV